MHNKRYISQPFLDLRGKPSRVLQSKFPIMYLNLILAGEPNRVFWEDIFHLPQVATRSRGTINTL